MGWDIVMWHLSWACDIVVDEHVWAGRTMEYYSVKVVPLTACAPYPINSGIYSFLWLFFFFFFLLLLKHIVSGSFSYEDL